MNTTNIKNRIISDFANSYPNFRDFSQSEQYRPYWELCLRSVADRDFLVCCIFCNDVFSIPPVKAFLTNYREDFIRITGDESARLDTFVKRSIGAFWGMVFKFVLGYREQKNVSVSMNEYFFVKTATYFFESTKKIEIEL